MKAIVYSALPFVPLSWSQILDKNTDVRYYETVAAQGFEQLTLVTARCIALGEKGTGEAADGI